MINKSSKSVYITEIGIYLILICLCFLVYRSCTTKPTSPILIKPGLESKINHEFHKKQKDSLNNLLVQSYKVIDSLTKVKQTVKIKYQVYYQNLDSFNLNNYAEILFEHDMLDDTICRVEEGKIVLFRLVQGAEARSNLILEKIANKRLYSIIDQMKESQSNDSIYLASCLTENKLFQSEYNSLLDKYNLSVSEKYHLNDKLKDTRKIGVGSSIASFVVGFFLGRSR